MGGSVAQWLVCRTRDPAVAGSIPTTGNVVIALESNLPTFPEYS